MAQADKKVPISIHDVATAAGVSVATVSRVLMGENVVKDDLREKVQRAIGQLGSFHRGGFAGCQPDYDVARSETSSRADDFR